MLGCLQGRGHVRAAQNERKENACERKKEKVLGLLEMGDGVTYFGT